MWIRHKYQLKRNLITRKIEDNEQPLEDVDFNTMYLDALIIFEKLSFDIFMKIIMSHNTFAYNPLKDFIKSIEWDKEPRIDQLGACINSNTGTIEWRCLMARRWYIGVVSAVFGFINELNFILVGGKNTGKTWFFTHLLPDELQHYFGRSQLNRGTDDQILMCEKLLILNDEYGGKNKMEDKSEKNLMSSPMFSLRVPYGRGNEDVVRLASLCGTCNDLSVLDDATGNRRIIVFESIGKFDYKLYNSLDKYQLLAEAYAAYQVGERPVLSDEEIDMLEANTDGQYSKVVMEGEMIKQYFLPPDKCHPWDFMTTTKVKIALEHHTRAQLNINKIGAQLKKFGYDREKRDGVYGWVIGQIPVNVVTQ
jgi:predicted P-loop ATPase